MSSRGELKIEDILKMNNIKFDREYIFPGLISSSGRPLRFDFVVFDDDDDISIEDTATDPRWDGLQNILENN